MKTVRSKTPVARSRLSDQSVGFSCVVTVRGAWVAVSFILESTTKVSHSSKYAANCFCAYVYMLAFLADHAATIGIRMSSVVRNTVRCG